MRAIRAARPIRPSGNAKSIHQPEAQARVLCFGLTLACASGWLIAGALVFMDATVIWAADANPAAAPHAATQPSQLTLPAMLVPDEQVDLYAKASGYLSKIQVDIGSRVRKGDTLLTLDIPELLDELRQSQASHEAKIAKVEALKAKAEQVRLGVESARAEERRAASELALSQLTLGRKQELLKGKAIPQQDFDEAKSQMDVTQAKIAIAQAGVAAAKGAVRAAQADVQAAQADAALAEADVARLKTLIGYTTIEAPFDGVVTRRNVDEGAFVRSAVQGAGLPLLVIAKVDRLRLVVDVPEAQAPRVVPGTEAQVQIMSAGGPPRSMKITRTAFAIRPDTRTMRTEIDIENKAGQLSPGMYARAVLTLSTPHSNPAGD